MFQNYLKLAIRHLLKHKSISLLNIAGLSVGIACAALILLWVEDEVSYNAFHEKADRIFRIVEHIAGVCAHRFERALAKALARDRLEPVGGDDDVGVDVLATERNGAAANLPDRFHQSVSGASCGRGGIWTVLLLPLSLRLLA